MQTIDMTCIRYLNLFEKVTGVRTKNCFTYNNFLIFAVPHAFISRAIGENGSNVRRIASMLGKRIKIVAAPEENRHVEKFIADIVSPITFKAVEVTPEEIIISGSRENKAALIGRNKTRLVELNRIIEEFFNKKLKIA